MNSAVFYIETIHDKYLDQDSTFFDKSQFSWAADLEESYPDIMRCLAPIFEPDFKGLVINPEVHIQFPPKLWKGFVFYFNGIKFQNNLRQFPFLADKLAKIPHLISASISVLEPGAKILTHNGSTNAIIRTHLPLKIPGVYPECGMNIENHEITWKEGEILMFCDMKMHNAQNLTHQRRYILLLDVMRPEFVHLKKKVCVHTIARIIANVFLNIGRKLFK
jgi:aspartyl/asparaginyl beta-hydroxylase (cupin superfamily)